jgi:hypothetical protein
MFTQIVQSIARLLPQASVAAPSGRGDPLWGVEHGMASWGLTHGKGAIEVNATVQRDLHLATLFPDTQPAYHEPDSTLLAA